MTDPLAQVPLFAGTDPARLTELAARGRSRTVEAGETLARHGEPATALIVLRTGTLTATRDTADGRRLRLGEFRAPCAVDKTAVLDGGGHTATWTAATRVQVLLIPAADLLTLLDDVPAARRHVLAHLAAQVRQRQDDLVRTHSADAVARIAAWLLSTADGAARVLLPGAQQGLGEHLGLSRVTVNRALRALAADGLIEVEPGAVRLLAPELLAARAG
ncbi:MULTISPECIES: Crp/Fnr family transcriptional regulator [unclassified Crossiella]|uniref:Crp/Fnr family transcriptional regulator n=1 Tax=unclassified Crossiella TaxID=2620835 RepID=UPI00200023A2|nr:MULTISPECIES: Crp/Fnr family transcriptional regulator [unclassified Crossiella]MCK2240299.1 Crp/Fnr family transcriptional regulator [Crossiella sp. S99.2]MCK2253249.1 Crp/Fnr family transcriptional regulator [Crossiella sp. S99.1]